jgi:RNA polymerase sigma-70 factor (ECF subfamily)
MPSHGAVQRQSSDPSLWVDMHGDCLFRYAMLRVRDASVAEDLVQETLLAALQATERFAGRASERSWLVGILKHKIVDHFRRVSRLRPLDPDEGRDVEPTSLFMSSGEWVGHWVAVLEPEKAYLGPIEWRADPQQLVEEGEFCGVFDGCLAGLPPRLASAFTMREMDGLASDEICEVLGVTTSNLWVMLHRARAHLRRCVEMNWFQRGTSGA